MANYIRFDWAMKRLLRNKANHAVLEGLMCSLLNEKFTIKRFLESEANQYTENDKFNRVDILAESEKGELTIFEIQNTHELSYFHRILYGVSKVITDYIDLGDDYDKVRKVYSINIVYFSLGQAKDYVYHGKTVFSGLHEPHDILKLSRRQCEVFFGDEAEKAERVKREAGDIFPEYYLLCVDNFDKLAVNNLDEWIAFLKTGEINDGDKAPGLAIARKCLDVDKLSVEERKDYANHMENLRYQRSVIMTGYDDGLQEGRMKGRAEGRAEGLQEGRIEGRAEGENMQKIKLAEMMLEDGESVEKVMRYTGFTREQVESLKK
uniref:Rpn family recombination-promoting nuclease/putative transposase n=1 Tax=Alloprevotella sp. TaxID=1872471 RepID=UPI0040270983